MKNEDITDIRTLNWAWNVLYVNQDIWKEITINNWSHVSRLKKNIKEQHEYIVG